MSTPRTRVTRLAPTVVIDSMGCETSSRPEMRFTNRLPTTILADFMAARIGDITATATSLRASIGVDSIPSVVITAAIEFASKITLKNSGWPRSRSDRGGQSPQEAAINALRSFELLKFGTLKLRLPVPSAH